MPVEESLTAAPVVWFVLWGQACSRLFMAKQTVPINPLFVPFPHPSARAFVPSTARGHTNSWFNIQCERGKVRAPSWTQKDKTVAKPASPHFKGSSSSASPCKVDLLHSLCSLLSFLCCREANGHFRSFSCRKPQEKSQWGRGRSKQKRVAGNESL